MDKKYLPLKVLHLVVFVVAFILCTVSIMNRINDAAIVRDTVGMFFQYLFAVIALIAGLVYVLKGFSKDQAFYYKLFMILYLASSVFASSYSLSKGAAFVTCVITLAILVLKVVICTGKDLGKTRTWAFSIIILVLSIITCLTSSEDLMFDLTLVLLTISVLLMAIEKYIDKGSRNTK